MREKRYYKGMKGTQGKEKERNPLKRKAIKEINEREGGFEEMHIGDYATLFSIEGKLII